MSVSIDKSTVHRVVQCMQSYNYIIAQLYSSTLMKDIYGPKRRCNNKRSKISKILS